MIVQRTARRRACSFTAAALAASLLATPAAAQWFGEPAYAPLRPRAVVRMLYDQGFREVGRPRWVGDRYLVEGVDRYGVPVRLAVDPYGDVLGRRNLAAADPVPPRNVGPGPVRGVPREFGRVDSGEEAARVLAPPSPRREADRLGERPQRQASRSDAKPATPRAKPSTPAEARSPEPASAKPVATVPAEPQRAAEPKSAEQAPEVTRSAPEARPEPAASPAAPVPTIEATRADPPREPATAAPNVRVIEGVTPVVPRRTTDASPPEAPAATDRPESGASF
jgi:hypothetical protein